MDNEPHETESLIRMKCYNVEHNTCDVLDCVAACSTRASTFGARRGSTRFEQGILLLILVLWLNLSCFFFVLVTSSKDM